MLNKIKIRTKLLTAFVLVSLVPMGIVGVIAVNRAAQGIEDEVIAKFSAIQEAKRNHINDYFDRISSSVSVIKDDPYLHTTMATLNDAYEEENNLNENDTWQTMVDFKEPPIKAMVEKNGFFEKEISREVETFGNVTHVFSTYETFRTAEDSTPFMRGINSIQLLNDGERWWIVNIYWTGETDKNKIPKKYLKG